MIFLPDSPYQKKPSDKMYLLSSKVEKLLLKFGKKALLNIPYKEK
ncbi:hypothetical protein VEE77_47190 (plasmid) [Escherichia coli]|nr:hypothetical protein VEE77_47190 [Escherichia coli]